MSDVIIFGVGTLVSLMVAGAVALLLWGAAREPRGNLLPDQDSSQPAPSAPARAPVASPSLESKSLA